MVKENIHFEFDLNTGAVEIEAQGFKDKGCKAATQPYELDLFKGGVEVTEKPEYRKTAVQQQVR